MFRNKIFKKFKHDLIFLCLISITKYYYNFMSINYQNNAMGKMKQLCGQPEKFEKKIIGKEFLLGKYFDGKKNTKINKKPKKYTSIRLSMKNLKYKVYLIYSRRQSIKKELLSFIFLYRICGINI